MKALRFAIMAIAVIFLASLPAAAVGPPDLEDSGWSTQLSKRQDIGQDEVDHPAAVGGPLLGEEVVRSSGSTFCAMARCGEACMDGLGRGVEALKSDFKIGGGDSWTAREVALVAFVNSGAGARGHPIIATTLTRHDGRLTLGGSAVIFTVLTWTPAIGPPTQQAILI